MRKLSILLETNKTIFTVQSLQIIFGMPNIFSLRNMMHRWKKQGLVYNVAYGIWALPHYDTFELANILQSPSYISLETVLYKEGIIFQPYPNTILSISERSREKKIDGATYEYHKIRRDILDNPLGIISDGNSAIATKERALCDRLYLTPGYYADNLRSINRDAIEEIALIYNNKRLLLDIKKIKNGTRY